MMKSALSPATETATQIPTIAEPNAVVLPFWMTPEYLAVPDDTESTESW